MKSALLIIDVQNAILSGKATGQRQAVIDQALDETVSRLRVLQEKARKADLPVILVQHDGRDDHRLAAGTAGWEIRPELAPQAGDIVVRKKSCDAFYQTDLMGRLNGLGVTHLVVGGCMTQFCVDTAVRSAVSLGYEVTLVSDGHMTADQGALSYADIIAHHNETLDGHDAGTVTAKVRPAVEIDF